jgi:putative membrane protein
MSMSMTNTLRKYGGVHGAIAKIQDTLGGIAGRIKASRVSSADSFVENAAIGDRYEIEAARVALRRSSSPAVRAIAERMVDDHTTSTHHLQAAMEMNETKSIPSRPATLDARRKKMLEHLHGMPEDGFDAAYLDQQILAHQETLTLMRGYRDKGDNPQLRSFAAGTAPVVERHLHRMKTLRQQEA